MSKYDGKGVVLEWDAAGGTDYTTIAQIFEITPPGPSRNSIDVTAHDSTDDWKEFIKGIKDGGEVSFGLIYDPVLGTHDASTGILSDWDEDSTIPTWRITFPDAALTKWTFPGFITATTPATPLEDKMTMGVTLKVSGKPTLA